MAPEDHRGAALGSDNRLGGIGIALGCMGAEEVWLPVQGMAAEFSGIGVSTGRPCSPRVGPTACGTLGSEGTVPGIIGPPMGREGGGGNRPMAMELLGFMSLPRSLSFK